MLPNQDLDDRTFQSLVDDARRHLHQRCPQWSDHNLSDPGITLIETFAMMVDQLIYRLNRVPDRHYVKFLELLGLEALPPGAAGGEVTFRLSAPRPNVVEIAAGTEVSTNRERAAEPVVFTTTEKLAIVPCSVNSGRIVTVAARSDKWNDQPNDPGGSGFECFSSTPTPGDAVWIGLDRAVPSCVVRLRINCSVSGVGVNPERPPYQWQAWTGERGWVRCEVDSDETKSLNKPGDVVLHVPTGHVLGSPRPVSGKPLGWLRCVLEPQRPGEPTYEQSPNITHIVAGTVGGTAPIMHGVTVHDEVIGVSNGVPGQRFLLQHKPVLWPGPDTVLYVTADNETVEWRGVKNFSDEDDDSKCFHIDLVAGEVVFGPCVDEMDERSGTYRRRHYGATPPPSATLRIKQYRTGGGSGGNVHAGEIQLLKTSVPYVNRVVNRRATAGGSDAETIDQIKIRGPVFLQARDRAVTRRDFEQLSCEASSEVGRAICRTAEDEETAGTVRVFIVPKGRDERLDTIRYEERPRTDRYKDLVESRYKDLVESPRMAAMKGAVREYLQRRTLIGTEVVIDPPDYVGLKVVASVRALADHNPKTVADDATRKLYRLLDPLTGGEDGTGWPLGKTVRWLTIASVLTRVKGVDNASEVTVKLYPFRWDNVVGRFQSGGDSVPNLTLSPRALVLSIDHEVGVTAS